MNIFAREFPLDSDLLYLNHAAVGVWPDRTAGAVSAFAEENRRRGAAGYPAWLTVERRLRERAARLIGAASAEDIALVANTSMGLSLIAGGIDWQAGDNVVSFAGEFPSNRMVWEVLAGQGVELRLADAHADDPEAALLALTDARTRLVSVSAVQYDNGLRIDLPRIGAHCRQRGVFFCVDAIQQLGALAFDAEAVMADFVVADGHKWLLGPEGLALFYSRPGARETLKLHQFGWHMVERAGDFDAAEWQPAASARRFEPGSPNMVGIYALEASLSLLEEIGMARVEARILQAAVALMAWVRGRAELELLTRDEPGRFGGIVTFRQRDLDAPAHAVLWRELMNAGVICAPRGGGIRFSPHCYFDADRDLPRLDAVWRSLVPSGR